MNVSTEHSSNSHHFSESCYGCAIQRVYAFSKSRVSSRNPKAQYVNCIRVRSNSYGGSTTRQQEGSRNETPR